MSSAREKRPRVLSRGRARGKTVCPPDGCALLCLKTPGASGGRRGRRRALPSLLSFVFLPPPLVPCPPSRPAPRSCPGRADLQNSLAPHRPADTRTTGSTVRCGQTFSFRDTDWGTQHQPQGTRSPARHQQDQGTPGVHLEPHTAAAGPRRPGHICLGCREAGRGRTRGAVPPQESFLTSGPHERRRTDLRVVRHQTAAASPAHPELRPDRPTPANTDE